jgi:hypothetical protein
MKYMRYLALVGLLMLPLAYSQAEVRVGIGIGFGPGYIAGPPVCAYGYYPDYPYGCAPYGYYGPTWFVNGIFIGAGPWYHGFGRPIYPRYYGRPYYGRPFVGRGPVVVGRGFEGRRFAAPRGFDRDHDRGRDFRGGETFRGRGGDSHGGFHGRR